MRRLWHRPGLCVLPSQLPKDGQKRMLLWLSSDCSWIAFGCCGYVPSRESNKEVLGINSFWRSFLRITWNRLQVSQVLTLADEALQGLWAACFPQVPASFKLGVCWAQSQVWIAVSATVGNIGNVCPHLCSGGCTIPFGDKKGALSKGWLTWWDNLDSALHHSRSLSSCLGRGMRVFRGRIYLSDRWEQPLFQKSKSFSRNPLRLPLESGLGVP